MDDRNQAGLTLLELLIAISLLGLVVLTLSTVMRTGTLGTRAVITKADGIEEIRSVHFYLRRQIGNIRAMTLPQGEKRSIAFAGGENSVSFIAAMPDGPSAGGLYRIRLSVENGRLTLLRRAASNTDPGFEFFPGDEKLVLATGVTGLKFRYFAGESTAKPATWQSVWTGRKALPQLIGMTVLDNVGEQWPDFIAALPLGPLPR